MQIVAGRILNHQRTRQNAAIRAVIGVFAYALLLFTPVSTLAAAQLEVGDLLIQGRPQGPGGVGPVQLHRFRDGDFSLLATDLDNISGHLALGPRGEIYFGGPFDTGVHRFDINAVDPTTGIAEFQFTVPAAPLGIGGIAADNAGNLYVAGESISDGTNSVQVLKWTGSGAPTLLVPVGCQNGGLCAVSDVAVTADGTLLASDFTDDQVVSFDPNSGAITGSAPMDRAGLLAGGLDRTAFAAFVPFGSAIVTSFRSLDLATGSGATIAAPTTINGLGVVLTLPVDSDGDGLPDDYESNNGFDPLDPTDATKDADEDGFTNEQEFIAGTDPNNFSSIPPSTLVTVIFEGLIETIESPLDTGPFNIGDSVQGAYVYESDMSKTRTSTRRQTPWGNIESIAPRARQSTAPPTPQTRALVSPFLVTRPASPTVTMRRWASTAQISTPIAQTAFR